MSMSRDSWVQVSNTSFTPNKIAEQEPDDLLASGNPFALVVLTAKAAFVGRDLHDEGESDKAIYQGNRKALIKSLPHSTSHPRKRMVLTGEYHMLSSPHSLDDTSNSCRSLSVFF